MKSYRMKSYRMKANRQLKSIYLILYSQITISFIIASLFFVWKHWTDGASALIGGSTAALPTFLFILIYFKDLNIRPANKIISAFYISEIVKWLITAAMFTIAFQWVKLKSQPLFVTFIATQLAFWIVPLIYEWISVRIYSSSPTTSHLGNKVGDV